MTSWLPLSPQIMATDADSGSLGSVSYALGTGLGSLVPSAFLLGEETGQLCTAQGLDRDEGPSTYDFTVTAIDGVSSHKESRSLRKAFCAQGLAGY